MSVQLQSDSSSWKHATMDIPQGVNIERIDESIRLLRQFVTAVEIEPVIDVLEALKLDPDNSSLVVQLADEFTDIGPLQGQVLTYAPYIGILVSNNSLGVFADM